MTAVDEQLEIRPFRITDQTAAKQLILTGLGERWGRIDPTLNPDLNDIASAYAEGIFLVGYVGNELVATGALSPEVTPTGIHALRVARMSVRADLRRQGIGRRVLDALLKAACQQGCRLVLLETTSTWTDAVHFYQQYGFEWVEERDNDTHMQLELEDAK